MATRCASLRNKWYRNPMRFPAALNYIAVVAFLLAITAWPGFAQIAVTVNYADAVNSAASPLLFGGSNEPNPGDQASFYPQATSAGARFERGSIHVDQVLPQGITLAEFQANTNGVANPANWNWGPTTWATNAHAQGWTTMANLLNAPSWLTYSGTTGGIPSNWSVWQQIVTAIIEHLGSNLNYIELLNEPTYEFNLSGSPYTSVNSAVDAYYYYGATAARAGSSTLIIGGDGEASGTFSTLNSLIEDTTLTANLLQFVSYHSYSSNAASGDSIATLASTLSSNGRAGLPIFLTEWNYTPSASSGDIEVVGNEVVTWMSLQMMLFSTQTQLSGADYFSFLPNNEVISSYEDCSNCDDYQLAFYSGNNGVATLLPQARVYQLFSVAMGLGKGPFKVMSTASEAPAQGFLNSQGGVVAAVVNDGSSATTANVTLNNIGTSGCNFTVSFYWADTGSNTAVNPASTATNQCITNGTMTLTNLGIPANAALGIVVSGSSTLIPNGTYIVTAVNSGLAIDDPDFSKTDGEDLDIYTVNDGTNQQWTVTNLGNNVITLTNGSSGQLMDIAGASKSSGALVDQWPGNGQTNQEWNVISVGSGIYELTSVNSGLALSVVGGGTGIETGLDQLAYSASTSQQWKFTSY